MLVTSLLYVPLATESVCLNLDKFSSGFEPSEVSVVDCNKIIYTKPKLQSTEPWALSQPCEMSKPEGKTVLWMQQAMS